MQILRNSLTGQNKSYETMEDFPNISMASRKEVSQLCPRDRSSKLERKCVYEDLTQIKMPGSRVIHQHSQGSNDGKPLIRGPANLRTTHLSQPTKAYTGLFSTVALWSKSQA